MRPGVLLTSLTRLLLPVLFVSAGRPCAEVRPEEYGSLHGRDPFQKPETSTPSPNPAARLPETSPPGLAGLLISEARLVGVAVLGARRVILLKGKDEIAYLAYIGSKLLDGYVEEVSSTQVVFIRVEMNSEGNPEFSRFVQYLNPKKP